MPVNACEIGDGRRRSGSRRQPAAAGGSRRKIAPIAASSATKIVAVFQHQYRSFSNILENAQGSRKENQCQRFIRFFCLQTGAKLLRLFVFGETSCPTLFLSYSFYEMSYKSFYLCLSCFISHQRWNNCAQPREQTNLLTILLWPIAVKGGNHGVTHSNFDQAP